MNTPAKMTQEEIHIVPYTSSWITKFEKEKKLLEETLGIWIENGIHHVGSTSIPGLSAKPIIDIMVGVKNLEEAKACIPLLSSIGYVYYPYKPDQMLWFCKPSPQHREYHLYLIEPTNSEWNARLLFRDFLRKHEDVKNTYESLKKGLADKYKNDRDAYTQAKAEFVFSTVEKAKSDLPS